jgi:hypothetical protein
MSESMFGKVNVTIKGLTPLLMNRLDIADLQGKGRRKGQVYDAKKEAAKAAHIAKFDDEECLYVPSEWIYSCIIGAAKSYHPPGSRASASALYAGSIRIEPEKISLGHKNYEIDIRAVNIVGSRVVKARPKIPEWSIPFSILYYKRTIESSNALAQLQMILEDAGIRMGIGDYRPQHKGWFGTFTVTKFEVEN